MPPIDESPSFEPRSSGPEPRKPKTAPAATPEQQALHPDLVSLTIDAATGRIVKVEGMDGDGVRRELSDDERARLAETDAGATLQGVVEQAFEAGIAFVLGDRADEAEEPSETDDDAELSRMLLRSMIERSAAKRLMKHEILGRAIVGTLIEQAAGFSAATPETAAAH